MHSKSDPTQGLTLLSNFFAAKKAKQNGLPRRWQTVLFLKDDIKGRYYSSAEGIIFILGFRRIDR